MKTKSMAIITAAALAVILAAALISSPAVAGDIGPAGKIRTFTKPIGPFDPPGTVGPFEHRVRVNDPRLRQDDGKPDSKKPGAFSGSGKSSVTLKFKFGSMNWRINLVQPVWIPDITFWTRPEARK